MELSGDSLSRLIKPLRCTSLHQSTLAGGASTRTPSLPYDGTLTTSANDSDDERSSQSCDSSDNESMRSQAGALDLKEDFLGHSDARRNSFAPERRNRRTSSASSLKHKSRGLSLAYTSPTTTARAINEVFSRRESFAEHLNSSKSPEAERANFLAELPDAIARARKVHYRRDALLPKTKSFNRVQNSLKEDKSPFESDIKKEATLAQILKCKASGPEGPFKATPDQAMESMDDYKLDGLSVEPAELVHSPEALDRSGHRMSSSPTSGDKDEPLFIMDDLPSTSATNTSTLFPIEAMISESTRPARGGQKRMNRSTKRKTDESRFEPYIVSNKRRAISPSPASPLGSPAAKGSIFRIEDLTL